MSTRKDGQARGKYTGEIKFEAVRLVKDGQAAPMTAKILGVPVQTLRNGVRLSEKGKLKGADDKPVSTEQTAGGDQQAHRRRSFAGAHQGHPCRGQRGVRLAQDV